MFKPLKFITDRPSPLASLRVREGASPNTARAKWNKIAGTPKQSADSGVQIPRPETPTDTLSTQISDSLTDTGRQSGHSSRRWRLRSSIIARNSSNIISAAIHRDKERERYEDDNGAESGNDDSEGKDPVTLTGRRRGHGKPLPLPPSEPSATAASSSGRPQGAQTSYLSVSPQSGTHGDSRSLAARPRFLDAQSLSKVSVPIANI
ncbi:hypothetical protein BS17DRAFT_815210 [Gyrodon lividus]|nr:hypothetical protein BS17DRAFT_815210 [Gyrodon lividus]